MTTMMTTGIESTAAFLGDYGAVMLGCGATCIRIEKNIGRMASAYGMEADIELLPSHVEVALRDGDGHKVSATGKTRRGGIDFGLNPRLSRLSWSVADDGLSPAEARQRFDAIVAAKSAGSARVLLLASAANMAFCRLFGGDAVAMAVVFCATLLGYRVKQLLLGAGRDVRLAFLAAAFVSASASAACEIFCLGDTPGVALGTSVLYLIPGVPYINAASDMIYRHYLCAISRLTDAVVLTACLTAGLCAGMFLLDLDWQI